MSTRQTAKNRGGSSTTSSTTEELIEALLDARLVEALADALSPFIKRMIDDHVTSRFAELDKSIVDLKKSSDALKQESVVLKRNAEALKTDNVRLQKQLDENAARLENLETYSRVDNLIFKGLPEKSYAERASGNAGSEADPSATASQLSVETTIIEFCRDALKVDISPQDISTAHRMRAGPNDKTRPVIVRFTSRRARESVLRAKKSLKGARLPTPVFISEQLTKAADALFYEARKRMREKKLSSAWTFNGLIYVKFSTDAGEKPTHVKALRDLDIRK